MILYYDIYPSIDDFYFQSLSPNPLVARYFQPVNLTFLLAIRSDGIRNGFDTFESLPAVSQYDVDGNRLGVHEVTVHETSSQVFILDLVYAGLHTSGNYTICMYTNFNIEVFNIYVLM